MAEAARRPRIEDRLARRGGWVELLRLPALLFGGASRLRGWLYDRRLLRIQSLDTPVVSVGNLTAGGTGKTPVAIAIAHPYPETLAYLKKALPTLAEQGIRLVPISELVAQKYANKKLGSAATFALASE